MTLTAARQPGFFGKLPVAGDFVSRRLPREFIDSWDHWLQRGLTASRANLAASWPDAYLSGPVWRFALNPGLVGDNAWIGMLLPSVDRVGRYFPLTIAAPIQNHETIPHYFSSAGGWFDQVEQVAMSGLNDELALEEFDSRLKNLVPELNSVDRIHNPIAENRDSVGNSTVRINMESIGQLPQAFASLTCRLLDHHMPACSLWCTKGSESFGASLIVCDGLPAESDYVALLTGESQEAIGNPNLERTARTVERAGEVDIMDECISAEPEPEKSTDLPDRKVSTSFQWDTAALTNNENGYRQKADAYLVKPGIGLWAIVDGQRKQQGGNIAGKRVIDRLDRLQASLSLDDLIRDATAALNTVTADVYGQAEQKHQGQIAASTALVLLAAGNRCAFLRRGDSRLYPYREGKLMQITRDHGDDFELDNSDVSLSGLTNGVEPNDNAIMRTIGPSKRLDLDSDVRNIRDHDIFLLWSKTLVKVVSPQEIETILDRDDCQASAQELVDRALQRGTRDNVNVLVVRACPVT